MSAFIASRGKSLIIAFATIEWIIFGSKRLVDERQFADMTKKTFFMPMLILIRQILRKIKFLYDQYIILHRIKFYFWISSDFFLAFFAIMSKLLFVASNAVWMIILKNITRAGQRLVAVPTAEMIGMKVLTHASSVFAVEY